MDMWMDKRSTLRSKGQGCQCGLKELEVAEVGDNRLSESVDGKKERRTENIHLGFSGLQSLALHRSKTSLMQKYC